MSSVPSSRSSSRLRLSWFHGILCIWSRWMTRGAVLALGAESRGALPRMLQKSRHDGSATNLITQKICRVPSHSSSPGRFTPAAVCGSRTDDAHGQATCTIHVPTRRQHTSRPLGRQALRQSGKKQHNTIQYSTASSDRASLWPARIAAVQSNVEPDTDPQTALHSSYPDRKLATVEAFLSSPRTSRSPLRVLGPGRECYVMQEHFTPILLLHAASGR